eukprot:5185651-Lingulodinium_polyedra.AAC.1
MPRVVQQDSLQYGVQWEQWHGAIADRSGRRRRILAESEQEKSARVCRLADRCLCAPETRYLLPVRGTMV